jgi:hypothetical protein
MTPDPVRPGTAPGPDDAPDASDGSDGEATRPGGDELLAAFERRSPEGSLQWAFDDALRRVAQPDQDSAAAAAPWPGLPDDLWQRGRSARIGQRFVGDVAGVLADILAADARTAADAAVAAVNGDRFVATWDALRYLAARVEFLERRVDPLGLEAAEWPGAPPDPGEWADQVGGWLGDDEEGRPVVVGEVGDGALFDAVGRSGRPVVGVEPRGQEAWRALTGAGPRSSVVMAEVEDHLRTLPDDAAGSVVLVGCVDRLDLPAQVDLVGQAVRVVRPGGCVVVLASDQEWWAGELSAPARDLAPGRPLHPDTWSILLRRAGTAPPVWHKPQQGRIHAVVAGVER